MNTNSAPGLQPPHETLYNVNNLLDPTTYVGAAIVGIVIIVIAWATARALRMAIHRYLDRAAGAGVDPTGIRFLGKLSNVGVYIFAFLVYSHLIPTLQHLGTAWLTSMGVLSVVLGLAAQTTLGNLIAGISLVLYRPFKLGDQLQISGPKGVETGTVESINLGTTVLHTADDRRLVIPNNTMASSIIINLSATRKGAPCIVTVTIAAGADPAGARQIMLDAGQAHPRAIAVDGCVVTAVSGSGTTLALNAWCANPDAAGPLQSELLETVKKKFDAAGIKLARFSRL